MSLHKIIKIIGILLSLAGAAFLGMMIMKGDDAIAANGTGIDGFIFIAYIIFGLVIIAVVIFGIKGLMSGDVKKTLVTLGAFLAIIVVSYVLADGTEMKLSEGGMLSSSGSKWVGTGLYAFYILGVVAIGTMIISGFKNAK